VGLVASVELHPQHLKEQVNREVNCWGWFELVTLYQCHYCLWIYLVSLEAKIDFSLQEEDLHKANHHYSSAQWEQNQSSLSLHLVPFSVNSCPNLSKINLRDSALDVTSLFHL
jgi:hypothetical protein